jgi:hypothetical protein
MINTVFPKSNENAKLLDPGPSPGQIVKTTN